MAFKGLLFRTMLLCPVSSCGNGSSVLVLLPDSFASVDPNPVAQVTRGTSSLEDIDKLIVIKLRCAIESTNAGSGLCKDGKIAKPKYTTWLSAEISTLL